MASPPFSLLTSKPADGDIAAVFPALDRSDKDVIQSWLLIQMNNQGHNLYELIDKVGSTNGPSVAPTPGANTAACYYDSDNNLKAYCGDVGQVEFLGVPPGTVMNYAGTAAPAGYLLLTGTPSVVQNVSRTTYARLFAAIGTTWGTGDGSTTFGLPPGDRIYSGYAGGAGLGAFASNGGATTVTLVQANLPNVSFSGTGTFTMTTTAGVNTSGSTGGWGPGNSNFVLSGTRSTTLDPINSVASITATSVTVSVPSGGTATPASILPPYAVMNKIIKF